MYTYEVSGDPAISTIYYNDAPVDVVGPWESIEAATQWASTYVNMKNAGI